MIVPTTARTRACAAYRSLRNLCKGVGRIAGIDQARIADARGTNVEVKGADFLYALSALMITFAGFSALQLGIRQAADVRRAKNGKPAAHPIRGDELRALRELQRHTSGGYVFETERSTPFTTDAVNRLVKRIGERASFPFKIHVHMLRHACGYALANQGHDTRAIQDWLGHRAIQHTARYTELSQERFKDFWRD